MPTLIHRDRGEQIFGGVDEGIAGQEQKAEAAPGSATSLPSQQDPNQLGHLPHCHLLRSKPLAAASPRPPLLARQHCWSVPSTTGGDEGPQLLLELCRPSGCHPTTQGTPCSRVLGDNDKGAGTALGPGCYQRDLTACGDTSEHEQHLL